MSFSYSEMGIKMQMLSSLSKMRFRRPHECSSWPLGRPPWVIGRGRRRTRNGKKQNETAHLTSGKGSRSAQDSECVCIVESEVGVIFVSRVSRRSVLRHTVISTQRYPRQNITDTTFPSGTRLGEWRKNELKSIQLVILYV